MKIAITGDFYVLHPGNILIDQEVIDFFKQADHCVVNLEAPVSDTTPSEMPKKSGIRLLQPPQIDSLFDVLSVDTLTLANNHIMDYGEEGYDATIANLTNTRSFIGGGRWKDVYKILIYENDGIRVGLINLCEAQIGILNDKWSQGEKTIGCAWINHPEVDELIVNSKKQVDKLIAICHCGIENEPVPLPEWRDRYRQLVRLGCDAVVAHHPHMVQGYEIYQDAPICYSLGNFCFVSSLVLPTEWNTGAVAMLDITKENISLIFKGVQLTNQQTTLRMVAEQEWGTFMVERNKMLQSDEYMGHVNEMCVRKKDLYEELYAMGGFFTANRHWLKNMGRIIFHRWHPVHALNNIRCESHRWCYCRSLQLNSK